MVLPTPPVPLKDHCSIIYNNVLYTYQPDAFQSLDLKEGGEWTKLEMGVPTNGSACVQGTVNNDRSFIVVGGAASTQNYDGLQHYSFSSSKWNTDNPLDSVARNRLGHGAAYIEQSSSILVYGGSQDAASAPSSQTFLMQTTSPYNVQAFNSEAPPVVHPLMMSWNSTHALMLGGDAGNSNLFTFGAQEGWQQLNVSLQNALKDSSKVQTSILNGTDGSKVLQIFDLSSSPNQLTTLLLQNATSTTQPSKRSISRPRHHSPKRRKRDITLANRPAYNNTLAPQDSRDGFSLASDPKTGLVVATGGNNQVPFAMFNETGNQWIDPDQFFGTEPTPSPTPTPSSSSTPPPPSASESRPPDAAPSGATMPGASGPNKSLKILGGVLGGVFGVALLLILILLLLRFCRHRRAKKRLEQENSYSLDKRVDMDFADVGEDFMKESGGTLDGSSRRSLSGRSNANPVVGGPGRPGAASAQSKRALLHAKGDSTGSGKSFWSRGTKSPDKDRGGPPIISAPILEPFDGQSAAPPAAAHVGPRGSPDPRTEPRTDTGWSRYFANNNSKDFATIAAENGQDQDTRPATYLSNSQSQSDYTNSMATSSHPHESAEVEPLSIRASGNPFIYPPNSRVVSPTGFPRPGQAITHGRKSAANDQPPSPGSFVSDIDEEDEYARHSHSDGQESWTPVAASGERGSVYSDPRDSHETPHPRISTVSSSRYPHPGDRVPIPNFPAVPDSQRPSRRNSGGTSPASPVNDSRGLRNIASKDFARSTSGRVTPIPETNPYQSPDNAASQVRTFPRSREDLGARGRGGPQTEDMSWLNLGTSAEQNNKHFRYAS